MCVKVEVGGVLVFVVVLLHADMCRYVSMIMYKCDLQRVSACTAP